MIFCSSFMLIAPEIFPKLCSISLLMSASSLTITGTISVFTLRIFVISISRSLYFEIFSVTFVEVFWSDGTDTSIILQHRLPWSLITTYIKHVRWQLSIRIYLCVPKDCNFFNFGDRLRLVFIAPLRYFDFVNADTPFHGYIAIASLVLYLSKNSVLDVRDIQCMIYRLFLLVTSNSL